jgi:hypothetical protein
MLPRVNVSFIQAKTQFLTSLQLYLYRRLVIRNNHTYPCTHNTHTHTHAHSLSLSDYVIFFSYT